MAELPEHAQRMLDELIGEAAEHALQAREALSVANSIQRKYGLALTTIADLESFERGENDSQAPNGATPPLGRPSIPRGVVGPIRPDRYLGLPPLEAAKQQLAEVGHALHIDVIADAISRGGAATKGGNWKETLAMSLTRSVADVIKVQDDVFSLTKFYTAEQIKALRATRRQPAVVIKRRGRPPKRIAAKRAAKQLAATED